ncbi:hypothetical protein KVP10_21115 [Candidimonas humi]|jgi:hypothetical protein|uniref:Uncharacterized protein n=1 Tax=Candidimonas humi TaxID=683355 RepID=A0ABV8P3E9_9BURK|nr:hypothetical protein [Candidimonas humi]MBV6307397.1 hypothetical protein [Candidimonas humi]
MKQSTHQVQRASVQATPSPKARQAASKGDTRTVTLNGSRVHMVFDGRQWWNVKVTPL